MSRMIACLFLAALLTTGRPVWAQGVWSDGFASPGLSGPAKALTIFDDGTGPALYAGGHINTAGGTITNHIAKRNGSSWSALGEGVDSELLTMTVFDDGTGPALYVGSGFVLAGGSSANRIAKWDGSAWSPLGSGLNGEPRAPGRLRRRDGSGTLRGRLLHHGRGS